MKKKPLIDHIDQIGVIVKDIDKTIESLDTLFGAENFDRLEGEPIRIFDDGHEEKIKAKVAFFQAGNLELELMEIISGNAIHTDYLKEHGEGIHHVGLYVDDFDSKLEEFKQAGIKVLHLGRGRMRYAYMDTKPFVIEIIEKF